MTPVPSGTPEKNYIMQAALLSKTPTQDTKFPSTKLIVPYSLSREFVRGAFRRVATKLEFRIIDRGETFYTAVHKPGFSFKRFFCCCKSIIGVEQASAIKLILESDEQHNQKVIYVKGLSGVLYF